MTNCQERVIYHAYHQTASSWDIDEWNISDTTKTPWTLKETIDSNGRVVELVFLENGQPSRHLCYLANRVTFEYQENRIIETLYSSDQELLATDCEMPYKTIYHLDKDGFITKTESFAKYDFTKSDSAEIKQWKEWVPEYVEKLADNETNLQIDYYYHSFAKMNGIYPVQRNFKLTNNYYYGDEPERESIVNGIRKLKKN